MAQSIFSLFGEVFVNTDKAEESLHKTEEKAGGVGKTLAKGIGTAAKWGAAIVGAGTAVAGAAMGAASKASETADSIDKMSQKIGISAESYQEWSYIMQQNGMDVDKLQSGMNKLTGQMEKAAEGNDKASEAFKALGIEVTNSDGSLRSQEEVMNEAIMALADMGDSTERARLQSQLFGKAGIEMAPMLNQGSDAIRGLKDRAHELGLVMSDEAITNGVEFGDLMDDLKSGVSMLGTSIGSELFPIFNDLIKQAIDFLPDVREMIQNVTPVIKDLMEKLLPPLMELVKSLLPVISDLLSTIIPILADVLKALTPIVVDILQALMPLLTPIINAISTIIKAILPPLSKLIEALMPILEPVIKILTSLLEIILPPLTKAIEAISGVIENVFAASFKALEPILEGVQTMLGGLIEFITGVFSGNWEQAWNGVVEIFKGIWEGLTGVAKAPLNGVIGLFNGLFDEIGSIQIPDWVPDWLGGGTTLSMPHIPYLAEGGTITASGSAVVGEAGAELVELPQGAKVTPLGNDDDLSNKLNAILEMMVKYMPQFATAQDMSKMSISVNSREFGRVVREVI